jgi:methyl-accepting chemotaxis protein
MMKLSADSQKRYKREVLLIFLKMVAIAMPIGLGGLFLIVNRSISMGSNYWILVLCTGIPMVIFTVSAALAYAAKTYVKPLIRIEDFCNQINARDFTPLEDVEGAGVMREVAHTLNELSSALKQFLDQASDTSEKLAMTSDSLLSITENSNQNLQDISKAVVSLAGKTEEQLQGVSRVEAATGEILKDIKKVEEAAHQALDFSEQVKQTVAKGADTVKRTAEKMREIQGATAYLAGLVRELDELSGEIGLITEVISSISDETKLLSLNAAIEAARAGEQGLGFSVVANEVRRLAEGSSGAAGQIEKLVTEIKNLVSKAMEAMEEASLKVSEGTDVTKDAYDLLTEIDEVSVGITRFIQSVIEATGAMEPVNREAAESVKVIAEISEQVTTNMQEASASLEEQAGSVEEITALMHELDEIADKLNLLIAEYVRKESNPALGREAKA